MRSRSPTRHLFGHTHGALRPFGRSVDVGVDNVAEVLGIRSGSCLPEADFQALYRPVSFEELKAFMDARDEGAHPMFAEYVPSGAGEKTK